MKNMYEIHNTRRLLTGLFFLWAALLFGGFLFGTPDAAAVRRMPLWTRLLSSFVLVVAGWVWLLATPGAGRRYARRIAAGMSCGFAGDVFMAGVLPVPRPVLWGMALFGLGHLFYIAAGLQMLRGKKWLGGARTALAWAGWCGVGVFGWYLAVWRGQPHTGLHISALPYTMLLASTAGTATGLVLHTKSFLAFAAGAALFLLSDLILAMQLFAGAHFFLIGDVIWLLYGPGQMLIVYSCRAVQAEGGA